MEFVLKWARDQVVPEAVVKLIPQSPRQSSSSSIFHVMTLPAIASRTMHMKRAVSHPSTLRKSTRKGLRRSTRLRTSVFKHHMHKQQQHNSVVFCMFDFVLVCACLFLSSKQSQNKTYTETTRHTKNRKHINTQLVHNHKHQTKQNTKANKPD